jgi:AcrR family transcriptional regulator
MAKTSNARELMIRTAIDLMRERGVEATSFSEVLAASGAPRGSIYHHFPDGKAQLIEEATRAAGALIIRSEEIALERGSLHALHVLADYWRAVLQNSDFAAGCPVAAVAVEGELLPRAREAATEAFKDWETLFAQTLEREGLTPTRARALATMVIAASEGAVIMARAEGGLGPLNRVIPELEAMLREALADARAR